MAKKKRKIRYFRLLLVILVFILISVLLFAGIKAILNLFVKYEEGGTYHIAENETIVIGDYELISDSAIVSIEYNVITGNAKGSAVVKDKKNKISYTIDVSDLYVAPVINNNKESLSCGIYSEEEADYLDEVLEERINLAGYRTRAGVVAAARFLTLSFPYKIDYFYENGRLDTSGERNYADGEGRYYHVGLYLHESRFADLSTDVTHATWGCQLYCPDEGDLCYNGLDCSGFVTWALLNGGYDPEDIGAGPLENEYDLTDLGEKKKLSSLSDGDIKVGDLIGRDGHIGIIIGIENNEYYIAEAYWIGDLHVSQGTLKNLKNDGWEYVMLMDTYYMEDGNLSNMW